MNPHYSIFILETPSDYNKEFISKIESQIFSQNSIERIKNLLTKNYNLIENKLINVHESLPYKKNQITAKGIYTYFHYNQDNFNDNQWGCAYRSLQTLSSFYFQQQMVKLPPPSIIQIQETLVAIGDKEPNLIGSKEWIGAFEVAYCLESLYDISSKMIYMGSNDSLDTVYCALEDHFQNQGTLVMFGGGQYAFVLAGVSDGNFLIVDPHYIGPDVKEKVAGKGVYWKGRELFDKNNFYNFCMPQKKEFKKD